MNFAARRWKQTEKKIKMKKQQQVRAELLNVELSRAPTTFQRSQCDASFAMVVPGRPCLTEFFYSG